MLLVQGPAGSDGGVEAQEVGAVNRTSQWLGRDKPYA